MAERTPIPLTAKPITVDSPEYQTISGWPFADPFVTRMLASDIPRRAETNSCEIWAYYAPDQTIVGFGTLEISGEYLQHTNNQPYPYIPLLAVNPTIKSLGYGTTIIRHLITEATFLAAESTAYHDQLFLDVYLTSTKAIALYLGSGFIQVTSEPRIDPDEEGKQYIIMSKLLIEDGN